MAGGMRRRDGPSLAERSGVREAAATDGPIAGDATTDPAVGSHLRGARHCWADPPGHPGPWPGLVVEWRRDQQAGWFGRCVYALTEPDGSGVRVVERWLPASCMTPVSDTSSQ